jgi:hypothetical protein
MRFTSAIDLVNKLEPAHLQCFWYFSSKVNLAIIATFGSLLWATSNNQDEAEFYKSQLAEYRWTLRVSSKAAEFMKFTVGMLDASPVFLKDGTSKSSKTTTPAVPPPQEDIQESHQDQRPFDANLGHPVHDFNSDMYGVSNEVSPSIGTSTENAYGYEMGTEAVVSNHIDTRPNWVILKTGHWTNYTISRTSRLLKISWRLEDLLKSMMRVEIILLGSRYSSIYGTISED